MRIKDIDNNETFQRLVHAIFVAEHGADLQVVDDRGGDRGNDGYIRSRKMLIAVYCPEARPAPDARYREKILQDLNRARTLTTEHGYEIETWAFVTPGDMREPIHEFVRDSAREKGFVGICIGEAFLTDRFHRNPQLHDRFPDLVAPQVLERLARIERGVDEVQALLGARPRADERGQVGNVGPLPTPSVARVFELLNRDPAQARRQLETIWLETQDPRERMLAGYAKAQLADPLTEQDSTFQVIETTLPLAERFQDSTILSILKAQKAWILTQRFVELDSNGYFYGMAASLVGIPLMPEWARRGVNDRLHQLRDQADALFDEAIRIAGEHRDYPALSRVLQSRGSALSHIVILHGKIPALQAQAERDVTLARAYYETAIRIEAGLSNIRSLATAYHNYANDLRMIGGPAEALRFAERALELEEANQFDAELEKTRELIERLRTNARPPD